MFAALLLSLAQPLPEIVRRRPAPPVEAMAAETDQPEIQAEAPAKSEPPLPSRVSLYGDWSLGFARSGTRCALTLTSHAWGQGLSTASLGPNCPPSLFAITRWRLSGPTLHLTDRNGRSLATLKNDDKGWRGTASKGGAVTIEKRQ